MRLGELLDIDTDRLRAGIDNGCRAGARAALKAGRRNFGKGRGRGE